MTPELPRRLLPRPRDRLDGLGLAGPAGGPGPGSPAELRRRGDGRIGLLSLAGVGVALVAAVHRVFRAADRCGRIPSDEHPWLSRRPSRTSATPIPCIFFGTLAGDVQTAFFNILYVVLLGLVVGLSMSWSFTEEWGEYFALMFWATVGMMLLPPPKS